MIASASYETRPAATRRQFCTRDRQDVDGIIGRL